MSILLYLYFGTATTYGIVLDILFYIGLWMLFRKSGVPGWWALVPYARTYVLAKCADREVEGRVACVISFLTAVLNAFTSVEFRITAASIDLSAFQLHIETVVLALQLIEIIYMARICSGLVEVYGKSRWWVWLWLFARFIPALIWGFSKKYQPEWEVEDLQKGLDDYTNSGSVDPLDEGLTVNLRVRTVMEFFHRKILLRDIHLNVLPGHMVLLLGGSGAGKTVFLNAISGYEKADASVILNGTDMYKQYRKMQYQVGYVPQLDTMRGKDTIYHTLMDAAKLRLPEAVDFFERRERVEKVMDIFGLTPSRNHMLEKLSGGQRKRVSIAMEFISNPSLFILDEPDSGLDGVMARELMEQLRDIADRGKIVIVITHTPDRVIDLFDDVIVLARDQKRIGRVAYYGSIENARTFFGKDSMEEIVKNINPKAVGGEGRADEFIEKYKEVQNAG